MDNVRVLVADDHQVLREGLATLLNGQPDMDVIGQAADGREAIEKVRDLRPDVLVVDITMPKTGGIEAIRTIKTECPEVRSLVLTMHDNQRFLRSVLEAGGCGYVTKSAASEELLAAIRDVARGRQYINVSLAEGERGTGDPSREFSLQGLSEREQQVLLSVARGYTAKEIATQLGVSTSSVEQYRVRLSKKLGLKSRSDLVDYALQAGLLAPNA